MVCIVGRAYPTVTLSCTYAQLSVCLYLYVYILCICVCRSSDLTLAQCVRYKGERIASHLASNFWPSYYLFFYYSRLYYCCLVHVKEACSSAERLGIWFSNCYSSVCVCVGSFFPCSLAGSSFFRLDKITLYIYIWQVPATTVALPTPS